VTADNEIPQEVRDLFGDGVDIQAIPLEDHELAAIIGLDLGDVVAQILADRRVHENLPKRGTSEYRAMLRQGVECTDIHAVVSGIRDIAHHYGWPGLVDFQTLLVRGIEQQAPELMRDDDGNVRLESVLRTHRDEAEMMEVAVQISNRDSVDTRGMDFTEALATSVKINDMVQLWLPFYQEAVDAARRESGQSGDAAVRAALVRLPGLREPDHEEWNVQGVLVLALAHMCVTDPLGVLEKVHGTT
jgi:hypothetical protein